VAEDGIQWRLFVQTIAILRATQKRQFLDELSKCRVLKDCFPLPLLMWVPYSCSSSVRYVAQFYRTQATNRIMVQADVNYFSSPFSSHFKRNTPSSEPPFQPQLHSNVVTNLLSEFLFK
jgi:hypothetical protein